MRDPRPHRWSALILALAFATSFSAAPPPAPPAQVPAAPPAPATPSSPAIAPQSTAPPAPSPVSGIRNKLAAGDLLSAESILEVHREKYGEDGPWLAGLGWLARGALLVGDTAKSRRYAVQTRASVERRLAGKAIGSDRDAEGALGAAIEVQAQLTERQRGRPAAAAWLRGEIARLEGPPAFRSRLQKRLNLLTLVGQPAPELVVEDFLLHAPNPEGELSAEDLLRSDWASAAYGMIGKARGRPLVLFFWAEWCADCKAQVPAFARVLKRHRSEGVLARAVTRWYEPAESLAIERARALRVWDETYDSLGDTPRIVSTESMVRYGASATPTFAFVDRKGIVRRYTATRLTEEELEKAVVEILR
jgi:thiol-disulfide isomerase/thioredoxin